MRLPELFTFVRHQNALLPCLPVQNAERKLI